MLVVKNVGLPVFKIRFLLETPSAIIAKVGGVISKGKSITIPLKYVKYLDIKHLRRCEGHKVLKLYSINERINPIVVEKKATKRQKTSKKTEKVEVSNA